VQSRRSLCINFSLIITILNFCSKNNRSKMSMATRTRSKNLENLIASAENNSDDDDDTLLLDAKLSSIIIFW